MAAPVAGAAPVNPPQGQIQQGAPANVFLDEAFLQSISDGAQRTLAAAAPQLKDNGNKAVDYSVGASEIAAKGASIAKTTGLAPSLAPVAAPSINAGVDLVGQQLRATLHAQVNKSVDEHLPNAVDASVKGAGKSINASQQKMCS